MKIARALVSVALVLIVGGRCGTQACCAVTDTDLEARARLRSILRRVHDGGHAEMRRYFPEGGLFTLSFTGFSLAALAVRSGDDDDKRRARDELAALLELTGGERDEDPFASWGRDAERGVIYEGHRNLLRAAYVAVGGDDATILRDFHANSARLARAFLDAPAANLQSFPHQVWPVDNVVALESLRLHDVWFHTDHARAIARWATRERTLVDDATGMPVSEIDVDGARVRDGPRGCALSWTQAFLPSLDAELGASLWSTYRDRWSVDVAGLRGLREWPPGRDGPTDADSGPVVHGIGAAASVFGVAAAGANGDHDTRARMLLALDTLTFPSPTWRGELELFGGHLLLADVLAVWATTWTRLDAPATPPLSPPVLPTLLVVALLLAPVVVVVLLAVGPLRAARGATLARGEAGVCVGLAVVVVAIVVADLSLPLAFLALLVARNIGAAVLLARR